jgi:hypothetical protein
MERTQDKTNVKQDIVKPDVKDLKHEGARETRPDRPIADRDVKPLQKRDEEQDKKVPLQKRDEEQDKQGFDADYGKENKDEAEGDADDAPDMAETESSNVVKTKPDDEEAPSQGI